MFITKNKSLLVISVLLAIAFLAAGLVKLSGAEMMAANFERFGYPVWFMYFVGIAEVAAAIGLFVQWTAFYSAVCLGILMIGAAATHLMNDPPQQAIPALVLLALSGVAAYINRGVIKSSAAT